MAPIEWLLFLSQLPASPSSLRVMVWRRMRTAGAISLQNGVWVLPNYPDQQKFMLDLLETVQRQEGTGQVFLARTFTPEIESEILTRFRADRDQNYAEFLEQCQALKAELAKETGRKKFSFAELEENEQNLERLETWLPKIQNRDFFGADRRETALAALEEYKLDLQEFSRRVYSQEGFEPSEDSGEPGHA